MSFTNPPLAAGTLEKTVHIQIYLHTPTPTESKIQKNPLDMTKGSPPLDISNSRPIPRTCGPFQVLGCDGLLEDKNWSAPAAGDAQNESVRHPVPPSRKHVKTVSEINVHWQILQILRPNTFFHRKSPPRIGILFASTKLMHRSTSWTSSMSWYQEHLLGSRLVWKNENASVRHLLPAAMLERWPHICRVEITITIDELDCF